MVLTSKNRREGWTIDAFSIAGGTSKRTSKAGTI